MIADLQHQLNKTYERINDFMMVTHFVQNKLLELLPKDPKWTMIQNHR
jgi:hypothetical protein